MLRLDPAQDGSCSVNQQFTKIDIAKFADPEEPRFADCRVFAGDEAEPVRQLAAVIELRHLGNRGDERRGCHRPDPWDGLQPLTFGMSSTNCGKLLVVIGQLCLKGQKLVVESPEDLRTQGLELTLFLLELLND
jgi:hypothetical protein